LDTNQVEKQVPALEQATEIVNSLAFKAVDALIRGPNRFLVAERLQLLGSVVVPLGEIPYVYLQIVKQKVKRKLKLK
jgi:hypothetical protein